MSKYIVVKIGGSTLGSNDTTLEDIVSLQKQGNGLVVVHGGGNLITRWLARQGIATRIENGLRVTDKDTIDVVTAVLCGLVNKELVAGIQARGGRAIGLSGVDGGLLEAVVKDEKLGFVGEVVRVNLEPLQMLLNGGYVPVVATLGFGANGQRLNINADTAAGAIAAALEAGRLVLLTDVAGVMDRSGKRLPRLSPAEANSLIKSGAITGGMIPKVEACLRAITSVTMTHVVDGREPHALVEALAGRGSGTIIA